MGVDTKLFLNSKIQLDEIRSILKAELGLETRVRYTHTPEYMIFELATKTTESEYHGRSLNVHINSTEGGFNGISLTMRANETGHKVLKCIANTFGGFFCESDTNNEFTSINGKLTESNDLPYFLRYYIVNGGNPNDLNGLTKTIKKWEKEIKHKSNIVGTPNDD